MRKPWVPNSRTVICPKIWPRIHPFFPKYAPVSTPSSYCIGCTGPSWLQGHRTTQTAHCAMRNTIAAEMNHSHAFRGRTKTKQKSFHLRDVQHKLQLGHWRMVCIWKTSSLSSRFVLTSCLLYRCDMGVDSNGCWLGNYCQDINAGDVTFVFSLFIYWCDLFTGGCPVMTKRGSMEKLRALAAKTDRSASGSGYSASGSGYSASGSGYSASGSGYTFGSGSD